MPRTAKAVLQVGRRRLNRRTMSPLNGPRSTAGQRPGRPPHPCIAWSGRDRRGSAGMSGTPKGTGRMLPDGSGHDDPRRSQASESARALSESERAALINSYLPIGSIGILSRDRRSGPARIRRALLRPLPPLLRHSRIVPRPAAADRDKVDPQAAGAACRADAITGRLALRQPRTIPVRKFLFPYQGRSAPEGSSSSPSARNFS
jgi:hypothetical protein